MSEGWSGGDAQVILGDGRLAWVVYSIDPAGRGAVFFAATEPGPGESPADLTLLAPTGEPLRLVPLSTVRGEMGTLVLVQA